MNLNNKHFKSSHPLSCLFPEVFGRKEFKVLIQRNISIAAAWVISPMLPCQNHLFTIIQDHMLIETPISIQHQCICFYTVAITTAPDKQLPCPN